MGGSSLRVIRFGTRRSETSWSPGSGNFAPFDNSTSWLGAIPVRTNVVNVAQPAAAHTSRAEVHEAFAAAGVPVVVVTSVDEALALR